MFDTGDIITNCACFISDSSDRHWIGMWWGGFLICGVALVLISIPFFFFPKELKVHNYILVL